MEPLSYFLRGRTLEEQLQCLSQIGTSDFDSVSLACDIELGTQCDIAISLTLDNRGNSTIHLGLLPTRNLHMAND